MTGTGDTLPLQTFVRPAPKHPVERYGLLLAAMPLTLFALLAAMLVVLRLCSAAPDQPWDGAGLVEAHRFTLGQPIYENPASGHPAWMYGPGTLLVSGSLFALTGPSILVMRLLSTAATAGTIVLGLGICWRWLPRNWRLAATASMIAIDGKMGYFGVARPDALALFLASAGLFLCYRSGLARTFAGSVLISAGTLTKQPVLAMSVIPVLVLASRLQPVSTRAVLLALSPALLSAVMLMVVKLRFPYAWFYMVDVPRQYGVDFHLLRDNLVTFAVYSAALWAVLAWMTRSGPAVDPEWARRMRWVVCACAVMVPAGLVTASKFGASGNSLMPTWFLLMTLCWLLAGAHFSAGAVNALRNRRLGIGLLIALTILLFPSRSVLTPLSTWRKAKSSEYRQVVEKLRTLDGSVMAPIDPSMTLLSRGQHDRSIVLDVDRLGWPQHLPRAYLERYYSSRFIVDENTPFYTAGHLDLAARGYRVAWKDKNYSIWERAGK